MAHVVITGGSRGIGFACVKALLEKDDTVIAAARKESEAIDALKKEYPDRVFFFPCDISKQEDIRALVSFVEAEFGALQMLVNAAGVVSSLSKLQFGKVGQYWSGAANSLGVYGTNNYQTIKYSQRSSGSTSPWELYQASGQQQYIDFENWKYQNGYNAAGTQSWRGGWSWVGENGPELAYLPAGSQVKSASESRGVGGDTFYITIDAKSVREFNDVVNMAQTARLRMRKEAAG